jgi:lysophospholipase L1-like esterase
MVEYPLPNPLLLTNGTPVTSRSQWFDTRRPELLELFTREMYGRSPNRPARMTFQVVDDTPGALGGLATRRQIALWLTGKTNGPKIDLLLYLPAKAKGPVPLFLGINFWGNHAIHPDPAIHLASTWMESNRNPWVDLSGVTNGLATDACRGINRSQWPVEKILAEGYGLATFYRGDITPDHAHDLTNGVHQLYPELQGRGDNFGTIAGWAWGLSRAMDYLETDPAVAPGLVVALGWSRLGKAALWAGATDERFAGIISIQSGAGGAALSKRLVGEDVKQLNTRFPHWFCRNFSRYNEKEADLPFDQHEVISLIAPRPLYVASAEQDKWADPEGEFLALRAASPVYELLGGTGLPATAWPATNQPVKGQLSYHIRGGVHDVTAYDWDQFLAFAREQLPIRKPTLFLIGDSTVKNGAGRGDGGQWGWGQLLGQYFDPAKIRVVNRALGGRSSRTFLTEGLWARVRDELQPGDFVLMQFGHNDNGELFKGDRPRASLKGNGPETRSGTLEKTGKEETVHTYGWYLRQYIADTKARQATPIVLSLVPRNIWRDEKIGRAAEDFGKWAAEAAREAGVDFVDLNSLVADRYEKDGMTNVQQQYFDAKDHTHTLRAGARANAECVVQGLRQLTANPLRNLLLPSAPTITPTRSDTPTPPAAGWRFDFGTGRPMAGWQAVTPQTLYTPERGWGLEPGPRTEAIERETSAAPKCDFLSGSQPFAFSVAVPEGNYEVTVTWGDPAGTSTNTLKAESRRLLLERLVTAPAQQIRQSYPVNVRRPEFGANHRVRLKDREHAYLHWDDRLTLEFNGSRPCVAAVEILPATNLITVYLAGDSTVTDQPFEPWNSWGQMLPRFFTSAVAVANHAESGESIRSSLGARRFDKIFSTIKPGDYLFFQFGHNDMKDRATNALAVYRENLKRLVGETRRHGAIPVLITSMERKAGAQRDTLASYPQTVRDVAAEEKAALIDLHAVSKQLYRALGSHLDLAFQDGTHHNAYGSYLLAQAVAWGVVQARLDLARHVVAEAAAFRADQPLPPAQFNVPPSPAMDRTKPDGN